MAFWGSSGGFPGVPRGPWGAQGGPGEPRGCPLYTEFLTVQSKNQKNLKNLSRKIRTLIKNEKQKCDLQFAPTRLNEFYIEYQYFYGFFIYNPWPIWGPWGGPRPPPGAQNVVKNFNKNLTGRSKIPCTAGGAQGPPLPPWAAASAEGL